MDHNDEIVTSVDHEQKRKDEILERLNLRNKSVKNESAGELKGNKMSEAVKVENIVKPHDGGMGFLPAMLGNGFGGAGAGAGAGLGAGLLGGVLGGALLGGRGLLGGERVADNVGVVTPMQLTSGLASVIDSNQNTVLLQSIGDVKAAVPLAEAQVQLAIAGSTASIVGGQALINKNISEAIAASLASQNNINVNVLQQGAQNREATASYGVANLTATKDAQFAITAAIAADGTATRTLINELNTQNLNRLLTVSDLDRRDEVNRGRSREVEVNVTQTVNQAQAQAQAQQQQQQQLLLLNHLVGVVGNLQNAVATNSNMIIGNTGAVGTGPQTANPVNVRT